MLSQNCQLKRLVNQHEGGELPPKKRKTEVILPISETADDGLGAVSSESLNVMTVSVVNPSDPMAELQRQLEREHNMRVLFQEQIRQLESQLYQHQQQPQLYQVEEQMDELTLQLVAAENLPPIGNIQTIGCSPQMSRSSSPLPTPEQRLPSVLEAAIKAEPKVEVERLPSPNPTHHEEPTQPRLYVSNRSRQNLDTIVEAIRHLEGDPTFGKETQAQDVPLALTTTRSTSDHLLKVEMEMNSFLDFHTTVQHQQQSRPGVIVVKQAS